MTAPCTSPSLDQAPDDIKLAVDLIYLLESHQIPAQTALRALELVKQDLENKLAKATSSSLTS